MRTEEEMFDLIIGTAKKDKRIRAVYMNGSRTNANVSKDIFQDYDIVYVVEQTKPFYEEKDWINIFGEAQGTKPCAFAYYIGNKRKRQNNMSIKVACSNQVDYAQVMGERILPFVFTLNEEESVLNPEPGQNQVFCYDVEGVGQDKPQFADLSHFLLGICSEITQEDIAKITVVVDGEEKEVKWGENVEIKTPEKPDNPTGCVGLKFDFPLDKVDGTMRVCIYLKETFAVGPVNVCVFGGNVTATGKAICGPACGGQNSCESVFFQEETVCVPVTVKPFANPGMTTVVCCGEPEINMREACPGNQKECRFTVTQRLCIEIPIAFGAVVKTGEASVECGGVTREACECLQEEEPAEPQPVPMNSEMGDRRFFYRK